MKNHKKTVNKYWIEKLRCALCNEIFSANIPAHVHQEKYHPSFKVMLALQKYYMAMPFHRQEYFQLLIGFPILLYPMATHGRISWLCVISIPSIRDTRR